MGGYWSSNSSSGGHQDRALEGGIPPTERRVLVALDGSPGSEKAFDFWAAAPGSRNDELFLFTSMEVPNTLTGLLLSQSGTYEHDEFAKQATQVRERVDLLERVMLAKCRERGLRCKFVSEVGTPGAAIVSAAKRMGANVVVVGCRGNNGVRRTILGSVSDYVLQHSARPVVVVPTRTD